MKSRMISFGINVNKSMAQSQLDSTKHVGFARSMFNTKESATANCRPVSAENQCAISRENSADFAVNQKSSPK